MYGSDKMRKTISIIALIIFSAIVLAQIPTFHQFYGPVHDTDGIVITTPIAVVTYYNGVPQKSQFSIDGNYGYSELMFIENLEDGNLIEFFTDGYASSTYIFNNEETTELILVYDNSTPRVLCDNGILDLGEECDSSIIPSSCSALGYTRGTLACTDCMFDTSPCSSGSTTTSSSSSSSRTYKQCNDRKDNDLDGLIDYPNDPGCSSPNDDDETDEICREDWICDKWEPDPCPRIEVQTRVCGDWNNCTTENLKPPTTRKCTYNPLETCDDGIQNQGEEGIDCGGPCPACPIAETPGFMEYIVYYIIGIIILIGIISYLIYLEKKKKSKKKKVKKTKKKSKKK